MTITPFRIDIPDADLDDLRAAIARTRWPDEVEDAGWDYGTPLGYLQELVEYWADGFRWRAREQTLNSLPQFRAAVDAPGFPDFGCTSCTNPASDRRRCRSCSATDGRARTTSTTTSSCGSRTRPRSATTPPTRSTSSCRRSPATASPTSRRRRGMTPRVMSTMFAALDARARLRPLRRRGAATGVRT